MTPIQHMRSGPQCGLSEEYLTAPQLAGTLGVVVRTLQRWHALGVGPPRCKVGRQVLYRKAAVRDWLKGTEKFPVRVTR